MRNYNTLTTRAFLIAACCGLVLAWRGSAAAQTYEPPAQADALSPQAVHELMFREGERAPFLGIFSHAKTVVDLDEKLQDVQQLCQVNPYISGATVKVHWNHLHPEPDRLRLEELEQIVDVLASHDKLVVLAVIPCFHTPDWAYEAGVQRVGPVTIGGMQTFTALPWDPKFKELFIADLRALADRYADDPRIMAIGVMGHNYKGEEMHTPKELDLLKEHGWSRELALADWKGWIDLYGELFPKKKLILTISQMYKDKELPIEVATYFVDRHQGRAILQTHQLNGRSAKMGESSRVCQQLHGRAPHSHEMVGSFSEQPQRQGSPEMVVYNAVAIGNPLFFQLWRRDCDDPSYAKALYDAWTRYGEMSPEQIKADLEARGLFRLDDDWTMDKEKASWQSNKEQP